MDHSNLLATMHLLNRKICSLESSFGLGARKSSQKTQEDKMALKFAELALGWIPDHAEIAHDYEFRDYMLFRRGKFMKTVTEMLHEEVISTSWNWGELIKCIHHEFNEKRFEFRLDTVSGEVDFNYYMKVIKRAVIEAITDHLDVPHNDTADSQGLDS
jgi:hypothetical protein